MQTSTMDEKERYKDIDDLLGGLFRPLTLKELFEAKLTELQMSPTAAQDILDISYRPLKRLLAGEETTVDLTKLFKLADFLQLPKDQVVKMYVDSLDKNHSTINNISPEKIKFIKENFELAPLKKAGFIDSISDFGHIEKRIISRLRLRSIFEYKNPPIDVAFSSSEFNPEHHRTRALWIQAAIAYFEAIDNQYEYSRDRLVKYFPEIRWNSTNEKSGLTQVVKNLFKIGITVIFQPPLENLKVFGATFLVNNKPCIVLTNYYGLYSTLWFTLIHELYHVLFDLDDIREFKYHLSDTNEQISVKERERLANDFAREYLFSKEKLETIRPKLNEPSLVRSFANDNHVHHSIIYAFHAFDKGKVDRMAWARARRYSPPVEPNILHFGLLWTESKEVEDVIKQQRVSVYN
jgi:HTH-type transcriptional regulator/antitoxin HigA